MRSVPVRAFILGFALIAGCKPEPFRPDAGPLPPDAYRPDAPPPYWVPVPGQVNNWDIQLAKMPFDVSMPRAMYVIDLWDAVPAVTMLDYGDGTPVMVPVGAHPGAITQIQKLTPPGRVACHVSTGAIRLGDPDAMKFPGHEANPPNDPNLPAAGSVIGWSTPTGNDERFIDINAGASRSKVLTLIDKRFELAMRIGCDAVVTRWNDQLAYPPGAGFGEITVEEEQSWSGDLVMRTHQRELSIGLRTQGPVGIGNTSPLYDWLMVERCAEFMECSLVRPYKEARKEVFAIEYELKEDGTMNSSAAILCDRHDTAGITASVIKKAALDSFRDPCP